MYIIVVLLREPAFQYGLVYRSHLVKFLSYLTLAFIEMKFSLLQQTYCFNGVLFERANIIEMGEV